VVEHAPRIRIAASTYIAKSALIQTACDGRSFGGRIVIADSVIISDGVIVTPMAAVLKSARTPTSGRTVCSMGMAASLSAAKP